jgi:hypothetical protein
VGVPDGKSYTDIVEDFFVSRPGERIECYGLARIGGFAGWRTRVSEARIRLEAAHRGTIKNLVVSRGRVRVSLYWFEPAEQTGQQGLFT